METDLISADFVDQHLDSRVFDQNDRIALDDVWTLVDDARHSDGIKPFGVLDGKMRLDLSSILKMNNKSLK